MCVFIEVSVLWFDFFTCRTGGDASALSNILGTRTSDGDFDLSQQSVFALGMHETDTGR